MLFRLHKPAALFKPEVALLPVWDGQRFIPYN